MSHDTPARARVTPSSRTALGLLERMKGLLFSPRTEWELIARESTSLARIYTGFVMPLAALGAVVELVQVSIVGTTDPLNGTVRAPLANGLVTGALTFVSELLGVFLAALIIDALVPFFGAVRNRQLATATSAYAATPVWVATVFILFPSVWPVLQVLVVGYHAYLLYLGLRVLMRAPDSRVFGYATTVTLCTIVLDIGFAIASATLGGAPHLSPYPRKPV